jgi:putative membrane protein
MQEDRNHSDRLWYIIIAGISVIIIGIIVLLIYKAKFVTGYSSEIYILPKMNAVINATVSLLLMCGYYFIRFRKDRRAHRACMVIAFVLSSMFLVSYLIYHSSAPETRFGDLDHNGTIDAAELAAAGSWRMIYFVLLSTHIILAACILPLVLLTFYRILRNNIPAHRRIARITLPLWLYVSLTGVVVYLLISKYYPV